MKLLNFCTLLIKTLIVTCVALGMSGNSAYGDTNSLTLEMSLTSGHSITQGEPILIRYKVINTDNSPAMIRTGVDKTEWYTLSLFGSDGKKAVPVTNAADSYSGASVGPGRYVGAGNTFEDYIVATRYFGALRPGRYTLAVHVHLPYALMDPAVEGRIEEVIKSSGTAVTQDFTDTINIAPINTARLVNTAETLREAYIKQRSGARAAALLDALFSMPEAQASPSWASLANNTHMDAEAIAKELLHVHTAKAADIIAEMLHNPALSRDEVRAVGTCLDKMYNTGDAPLKAHIKQIAASGGITLPEKILIPQPID